MYDRQTAKRKIALGLSALAIIGMGSITVACSPRTEKPAAPGVGGAAPPPWGELADELEVWQEGDRDAQRREAAELSKLAAWL